MRVLVVESDRAQRRSRHRRPPGGGARGGAAAMSAGVPPFRATHCATAGVPARYGNRRRRGSRLPRSSVSPTDAVRGRRELRAPAPVPLVIAGAAALNPFDEWTTAVADDESVVDACERAAAAPIKSLTAVAWPRSPVALGRSGPCRCADVTVTRNAGTLQAVVAAPRGRRRARGRLRGRCRRGHSHPGSMDATSRRLRPSTPDCDRSGLSPQLG